MIFPLTIIYQARFGRRKTHTFHLPSPQSLCPMLHPFRSWVWNSPLEMKSSINFTHRLARSIYFNTQSIIRWESIDTLPSISSPRLVITASAIVGFLQIYSLHVLTLFLFFFLLTCIVYPYLFMIRNIFMNIVTMTDSRNGLSRSGNCVTRLCFFSDTFLHYNPN